MNCLRFLCFLIAICETRASSNVWKRVVIQEGTFQMEATLANIRSENLCLMICLKQFHPCDKVIRLDFDSNECHIGSVPDTIVPTTVGLSVLIKTDHVPAPVPHIYLFNGKDKEEFNVPSAVQDISLDPASSPPIAHHVDLRDWDAYWHYDDAILACKHHWNLHPNCERYSLKTREHEAFDTVHVLPENGVYDAMFTMLEGKPWLLGGQRMGQWNTFLHQGSQVFQPDRTWTAGPDLPHPIHGACIASLNDADSKHVIAGGIVKFSETDIPFVRNAWVRDNASPGTWTQISNMPGRPLYQHSCAKTTLDSGIRVIVSAGGSAFDGPVADVNILDIASLNWFAVPSMPQALTLGVMASVPPTITSNGLSRLFFIGGHVGKLDWSTTVGTNTVYELNLGDLSWTDNEELRLGARTYGSGAVVYLP